jgi:hypothetical protein
MNRGLAAPFVHSAFAMTRRLRVSAAEDVQRQIAVAIVVAVEEAPLLMTMQRIIGRIEIEDDLLWRRLVRLQEHRHKQPFDGRRIMRDLVVARRRILSDVRFRHPHGTYGLIWITITPHGSIFPKSTL